MRLIPVLMLAFMIGAHASESNLARDYQRLILTFGLLKTQDVIEEELARTQIEKGIKPSSENDYLRTCQAQAISLLQKNDIEPRVAAMEQWLKNGQDKKALGELLGMGEDIISSETLTSHRSNLIAVALDEDCPKLKQHILAMTEDLNFLKLGTHAMCTKLAELQFKAGGCRK